MDVRMFLVVLGLVATTFAISDLEFAKEYNSKEGSVRRKPELRLDEAWLTINSTVNFNILLFSLNDQCWKCDPVFVDIIPRFSIYTLKVNTTFGTTIYLKENDLTGTLDETFCTFHKKFTESGDYWVFVSNQEFIQHDCKLLQTNDPLPAEMRKEAAISTPDESVKETCDGDTFCVDIKLETNTSQIEVFLPQQQSNSFLWCKLRSNEELQCVKDASVEYKRETESLQFCMKFNQTKHSENEVVVKRNGDDYRKILLLPCRDGFKAKAEIHNKTHVTITCEHDLFNLSNTGIKIEIENNIVAQCKWDNECIGAEALANGIQFITDYDQNIKYRCAMDGQSVQINYTEQGITNTKPGSVSSSGSGESNRLACSSCILLEAATEDLYVIVVKLIRLYMRQLSDWRLSVILLEKY